jgi:hypothetical protein
MKESKQLLMICLIVAIASVGTFLLVVVETSQYFKFKSASLFFELQNQGSKPINVSFDLITYYYLNFNGTNTQILQGTFNVSNLYDGSGVKVDCNNLEPSKYLSFKTDQIKPTPSLQQLQYLELVVNYANYPPVNASDFSFTGTLSFLNNQGISVASVYQQNYYPIYDRTVFLYLNMLIVVLTALSLAAVAMTVWQRAKWFPIITASIVAFTLILYVFVGSGYELLAKNWMLPFFAPLAVFIHGFDWHIFGDLVYFVILSTVFEWFLRMKGQWMKKPMLLWYFAPLFVPTVLVGGFGLSLSIEIMTWTLWTYIVMNYRALITDRIRTFLAVLAGIPSYVFIGWVATLSFGSENQYDMSEALLHVLFGIASGLVLVVLLASRRLMRSKESHP